MTAPTVAIGLPVYNGGRWLEATMASVLAQRGVDFELIVSDNASTDDTQRICRALAAQDSRIRYHRNSENVGVANNFSHAFRLSRSRYFKWMSCADAIAPSFLERCVAVLEARPEVALAYPVTRLFEDDPTQGIDTPDTFDLDRDDPAERFMIYLRGVALNNIMHGVYRADVLARTRLYSPFVGADINMIAELLLLGRAVQLPLVLNFRRSHPDTMTRLRDATAVRTLYAPNRTSALKYQAWAQVWHYFTCSLRAGRLTLRQRARVTSFVSRMALWRRDELVHELMHRGTPA